MPLLRTNTILLLLFSIVIAGCATVEVKRVRDDDYTTSGFRFYRPRPYIVMNKSFPIIGDDFFIYGAVDATNRVVVVDASHLPDPLKSQFIGISRYKVEIPMSIIKSGDHVQEGLAPSKGREQTVQPSGTPSTPSNGSKQKQTEYGSVSSTQPTTQQSTVKTTIDPSVDPLEKLSDYISVVYLPDFDQQYAITTSPGFGTASGSIQMKNGWMTEDASWSMDNRELGQFVFGNINKLIDLATTVGEQAAAPGTAEIASATKALVQQGAHPPATVLLRVRFICNASPGLYPVLKPDELSKSDGEPDSKKHIIMPLKPYTVVAYNYSTSVAIELVSVSALPSKTDMVGTQSSLSSDDQKLISAWLTKHSIAGLTVDPNTQISLDSGILTIPVTGTPPDGAQDKLNTDLKNDQISGLTNSQKVNEITLQITK
jgi:hypothetical protein